MSTFLTPPVWYDQNGNLNKMLTGYATTSTDIAIGSGTEASDGGIAIGSSGTTARDGGIAIGNSSSEDGGIAIEGSANGGIAIGGNSSGGIAIGRNSNAGALGCIAIGNNASVSTPNTIQLGNNNTAYTLNIGNGKGTLGIGNFSCDDLRVKVIMRPPLVGFDLNNNFDSGYVNIGNNSDGTPWSYAFSLVADTNHLYKNRIDSIPYLLVRVTFKPDVGLPHSMMCPTLIPNNDSWSCRSQWNVIEMNESLNSILSMRLSSSLDNVGNPKITIALRSPSGQAINQDYKKVALEVVRVLNTNFTTP